jgi:hypothetical protein
MVFKWFSECVMGSSAQARLEPPRPVGCHVRAMPAAWNMKCLKCLKPVLSRHLQCTRSLDHATSPPSPSHRAAGACGRREDGQQPGALLRGSGRAAARQA